MPVGGRLLLAHEPGLVRTGGDRIGAAEHHARRPLSGPTPRAMRRVAAFALLLLVAAACGTTTIPSTSVRQCRTTSECPRGNICLFYIYESCGNPGVCLANTDAQACVPQTACGCTGMTEAICLVNGSSPSPIQSLGSCDGAMQQPDFDASVPPVEDSSIPPTMDSSSAPDTSVVTSEDSGGAVDSGFDAADAADAADTAPPVTTLGTPCTSSAVCTDPNYPTCADPLTGSTSCHGGTSNCICTTGCLSDEDCQQPPADGTCNLQGICQL
jgi:hypothetical protein